MLRRGGTRPGLDPRDLCDAARRVAAEFLAELLSKRGLAVDDELRARLDHCTDEAQLQRWFDRALTATTVAGVFG